MENSVARKELSRKVLIHLYNSAVLGALRSTALVMGTKDASGAKNPRLKDMHSLFERIGKDRRLFYAAAAAVAEFAVYLVLDFVETYNRFDSEDNEEDYPHVSLVYTNAAPGGTPSVTLSEYGSEELGDLFKQVARSEDMQSLVESVIDQLATR
jgi:hypothetical protein